jgi:lipid-A-disaccharide synthase
VRRTSLKENTDLVATPFPSSEAELTRLGVNARFVGHPLLDLVTPSEPPATFADRFGIETEHPVVGLFPGSRRAEIEHILPAQLMACGDNPATRPRRPVSDRSRFYRGQRSGTNASGKVSGVPKAQQSRDTERGEIERRLREWEEATASAEGGFPISADGQIAAPEDLVRRQKAWIQKASGLPEPEGPLPLVLVEDMAYDVMTASDVVIMASGTATLEAAILGKPMVILYKMSRWNKPQYWLVRKSLPQYIGLPNLLADKRIVPEFVQDDATPDALAESVIDYLLEPDRMLRTREDLAAVRAMLGQPGGAARTAQLAVDLVERNEPGNRSTVGTVN